mgnify:CR=1 FL=1
MENWQDHGLVLEARPHGEGGCIITTITEHHGLYAGYVAGGMSKSHQGIREIGALVSLEWQARLEDYLGRFKCDLEHSYAASILSSAGPLKALKSACALCRSSMPERDPAPAQFHGLNALLETLSEEHWPNAYIIWEIGFLTEHGCPIDLTKCASTGQSDNLAYVSPKSARAVSKEAGDPYKDKLLVLPAFLGGPPEDREIDIYNGLKMTGYFITHHLYGQTTRPVPIERQDLQEHILNHI